MILLRLLMKDQFKKIKNAKWQFISLSILVFLISFTYTASKVSVDRLYGNYDSYLSEQQVEDFYMSMGEIDMNKIGGTATLEVCESFDIMFECAIAFSYPNDLTYINRLNNLVSQKAQENPEIYEAFIDKYIDIFSEEYDISFEKQHVTTVLDGDYIYKFIDVNTEINIPYVVEGTIPTQDYEIMVFPEFADIHNLDIDDTYTINNTQYTITGFFYAPAYMYPVFSLSTVAFDESLQTMVLTTENTMFLLGQYLTTKYVGRGDIEPIIGEQIGFDTIQNGDFSFLGKQLSVVRALATRDVNIRLITLELEVENARAFIDVFLPLFITFITILLTIFMKRYIDKNRNDIFTLHALGYKNTEIAASLLVFPLLVSLSSIIGYSFGLLTSNQLFETYSKRYLFPKADFSINPNVFVIAVVIPIIAILLINYVFILQSLQFKKESTTKMKLSLFKFTPNKTIFTTFILFITINVMIIFGLNGNSIFSGFIDETKLGNNYTEMVNLRYMTNSDHLDTYEEYIKTSGIIIEVNSERLKESKNTTLYGIETDNKLKLLINNDMDNNLLLNDGIIISKYLESSLSLQVGDTLTFMVGGVEMKEEIVGISNELIENNFYILKIKLNEIYRYNESYYNGLMVDHEGYENELIFQRIDYQKSLDEMENILIASSIILTLILVLSIILSIYIFILILTSYFKDNITNIAILKSIGYNNKEINKRYLLPIYIILLVTFIVSIPLAELLLDQLMLVLMNRLGFKLVINITLANIIIGFIALNVLFLFTLLLSNKYYEKIQVSDLLKGSIN